MYSIKGPRGTGMKVIKRETHCSVSLLKYEVMKQKLYIPRYIFTDISSLDLWIKYQFHLFLMSQKQNICACVNEGKQRYIV